MLQISTDVILGMLCFGTLFIFYGVLTKSILKSKIRFLNILAWFTGGMTSFTGFYGISSLLETLQSNHAQGLNTSIIICVVVGFYALQSHCITSVKYHLFN